eukprot:4823823-Pleurochrysis_carterae.AAC.1
MPYTGFSMRHTRGLPSAPSVAYPGGAWHYTTPFCSSSPCWYAATKSQRRMRMPAEFAIAASARRDVGRRVAQKVWSKSTSHTWAQPCTQSLAFSAPGQLTAK